MSRYSELEMATGHLCPLLLKHMQPPQCFFWLTSVAGRLEGLSTLEIASVYILSRRRFRFVFNGMWSE